MPRPLVIGYHLIWTGYGWWLPNDPRGSGSKTVATDVIAELGELHYGRRAVQPSSKAIREFYRQARVVLKFPLLMLDAGQREYIAAGFAEEISRQRYTCYACAVMPDHVHLLIRKHKHQAEEMIENLQRAGRRGLLESSDIDSDHPIWTPDGWKVFLDRPNAVRSVIRYIEDNPMKAKMPKQNWPFVTLYDGWPLHPGHDPNSPYARRLRKRDS